MADGPPHPPPALAALLDELLEAQLDTLELVADQVPPGTWVWEAHAEYLRFLQRAGQAMLAAATVNAPLAEGPGR